MPSPASLCCNTRLTNQGICECEPEMSQKAPHTTCCLSTADKSKAVDVTAANIEMVMALGGLGDSAAASSVRCLHLDSGIGCDANMAAVADAVSQLSRQDVRMMLP